MSAGLINGSGFAALLGVRSRDGTEGIFEGALWANGDPVGSEGDDWLRLLLRVGKRTPAGETVALLGAGDIRVWRGGGSADGEKSRRC